MGGPENAGGAAPALLCVRCRAPLPVSRVARREADGDAEPTRASTDRVGSDRACAGCGAPVRIDEVTIDVIADRAPPASWGARAMQSGWIARIYETWWRPLAFGLSTGFGAPRAVHEARLVLEKLATSSGPWLDLSCGPGSMTRELVARAEGRAVVGVDISRAMLERARTAAPAAVFVRADAAALPFGDGVFGGVVNLAALDLYADPARVIAESARVLAPGGRWVCSTFVAQGGARRRPSLSALSGARAPTIEELAEAVASAGLAQLGTMSFRRYVIAWADKA
jgi:ubiquinone/menaquinone biosynthesis C-methylase UbiE